MSRVAPHAALEQLRLRRDWTYTQLATEIADATGYHRTEDTWRRLCLGIVTRPHARTVQALAQFLTGRRARVADAAPWWQTGACPWRTS